MGIINAENTLRFKSSTPLFDRISKRLSSFDSAGLIDTGDFHKLVKDVLEQLGVGVYKECEAILHPKEFEAKLPDNFKMFHAAYRCSFKWHGTKSINEQRPIIFYRDTENTQICSSNCKLECSHDCGKTKIVIRTFVEGDEVIGTSHNLRLLQLSPNVRSLCTDDCPSLLPNHHNRIRENEININSSVTHILTNFNDDKIYIQYYGLPIDEHGMPMIPDQTEIEKAIEYYIYSQLFEEFYWNSTIPDIVRMLGDVRVEADKYMSQAKFWVNLPSFQKMVNSIRRQRGNKKFYYFSQDRTVV